MDFYLLNMPQIIFILVSCGSIFLMPFIISRKCARFNYLLKILVINAAEIVLLEEIGLIEIWSVDLS